MKHLILPSLLFITLNLRAAVIPYDNTFSSPTDAFPNSTSGQWAVSDGSYVNSGYMPDNNTVTSTASLQLSNVADFTSLTLTTQFSVPSISQVGSSSYRIIGIGFLGSNATFSGGASTPTYLAQYVFAAGSSSTSWPKGGLTLSNPGDSATGYSATAGSAIAGGASGTSAIVLDTTYTLKLTLTLNAGTLSMTFGLYDAAGTTQIGTSATATDTTPLAGSYFGYYNRFKTGVSTGITQTVEYENFTVVPEPRTTVFAFLAAGILLAGRASRRFIKP